MPHRNSNSYKHRYTCKHACVCACVHAKWCVIKGSLVGETAKRLYNGFAYLCICLYLRICLCWASVTRQQQYLRLLLASAFTSASASAPRRQQQQSFFDEFALLPNCATPTLRCALFLHSSRSFLSLSLYPSSAFAVLAVQCSQAASVIIKCNEICLQWNPLSLILIWLRLCCCAVCGSGGGGGCGGTAAPTMSRLLCI